MRAKRYGDAYRGRKNGSSFLKFLIAVLAALLALGILFIIIMGEYIEYTPDGVKVNLPWLVNDEEDVYSPPGVSGLVVIESHEPEPSPEPSPEARSPVLRAIEVSPADVTAGTAAAAAAQAGGDALVVRVKDWEGFLAWQSQTQLAQSVKSSSGVSINGDPAFNQAVGALSGQDGLYLVARMDCFRDLWVCVADRSMALTNRSGKLWYDSNGGYPRLSPASEAARGYIDSLCLELAQLGFDEILLECAGFPVDKRAGSIAAGTSYPAADQRAPILSQWLTSLSAALEAQGVVLSVRVSSDDVLTDTGSGLTAAALASSVGRVWMDSSANALEVTGALTQNGMDEAEQRMVWLTQQPADGTGLSWAVLLS